MRKLTFTMIVLSLCLASVVSAGGEIVGDLNAEMNGTANQAGNWAYGWLGAGLDFHLLDIQLADQEGGTVKGWNAAQGVTTPQIYFNGSSAYFWGANPGEHLCCPPSWENVARYVTFRWTAPTGIAYTKVNLSGYCAGHFSNMYKKFTVFKNGVKLFEQGFWLLWLDYNVPDVDIAPGDVIDFAMDKNSEASSAHSDHSGISCVISLPSGDPNEVWPDPQDPATDWDFQRDFRKEANPTGAGAAWRMGMGFDPLDTEDFILYENHFVQTDGQAYYGTYLWNHAGYGSHIYKNMYRAGDWYGIPPMAIGGHPGPVAAEGSEYIKVRWVSPITAVIQIVGSYGVGNVGAIEAWVVKDGTALLTQVPETFAEIPFDLRTEVVPGTIIDLVLGMGSEYNSEATPIYALISRVDSLRCKDLPASAFLATDFNKDCYINLEDFAALAGDWLKCNDPMNSECIDVP